MKPFRLVSTVSDCEHLKGAVFDNGTVIVYYPITSYDGIRKFKNFDEFLKQDVDDFKRFDAVEIIWDEIKKGDKVSRIIKKLNEEQDMPITITEKASQEIRNIIKEQELSEEKIMLRIGVKGGGCTGFSYILDLTENQKENDEVFENNGLKIVVDSKSLLYLDGTTIDFKDEIMGRGFVFNNPNATSVCGCGSSFSA